MLWESFTSLLREVDQISSPIFSLLKQTADRPREDWKTASNHILRWCVFGDRTKVLSTICRIRDSAMEQVSDEPRAQRVLDVISFLLSDTAHLEPTLGLHAALNQ
jgi:hypothetical protein